MLVLGLLLLWMGSVDSAPITSATPDGCVSSIIPDPTSLTEGLFYSCDLNIDNKDPILRAIKQPHILRLDIVISQQLDNFVFNDNSFSKDLKNLTISSIFPFYISTGSFNRSTSLEVLYAHQIHDMDISVVRSLLKNPIVEGDMNLTSPTFGKGWLAAVPGLLNLTLSKSNISSFRVEEFCVLHQLQTLNLSHNRISTAHNLGIARKDSQSDISHTSCLPNLTLLDISHNPIYSLNMRIEEDLPSLQHLDMSHSCLSFVNLDFALTKTIETLVLNNNEIVSMFIGDLCNKSNLKTMLLQNNHLQNISSGLFACMDKLQYINVSNNSLTLRTLHKAELNNLTQLQWLDVSYNPVKTLNSALIGNLTELLGFNCISCSLTIIRNDSFLYLEKLRALKLAKNMLHVIDGDTLSHLCSLQMLDLSENDLNDTAFITSLAPLKELYLGHNQLSQIPNFQSSQQTLSTLILGGNTSRNIKPQQLSTLTHLRILSLASNFITDIPDNSINLHSLKSLHINNNNLKTIGDFAFDRLQELIDLRLDNNYLTGYPPIKQDSNRKLRILNLSRNLITRIEKVEHQAEWIDLSYNRITKFNMSIEKFANLKFLNLSQNQLQTLEANDFYTGTLPKPRVYLEGNPLHCDCHMEWLLETKTDKTLIDIHREIGNIDEKAMKSLPVTGESKKYIQSLAYAEVSDLDLLQCTNSATGRRVTLSKMTYNDFVCPYNGTCFKQTCKERCCHKEGCPCNSVCYPQCKCYRNNPPGNINFMNCSSRNMATLPAQGPKRVNKIYLDGNNLTILKSSTLSYPDLLTLYINNSHIADVEADAFRNIPKLTLLDLHQNHIGSIRSETFNSLNVLEKLYLQENHIHLMENNSLNSLPHLRTLWLDGNNLHYLNLSILPDSLTEVTLHDNPWVCDCQFGPAFKEWIVTHAHIIMNHMKVYCTMKIESELGLQGHKNLDIQIKVQREGLVISEVVLADFASCGNKTILKAVHYRHIKSMSEIISLIAAFLIIIATMLVIYKNRTLLRVCMYNKCGIWFHHNEAEDKPYDVFIAYDKKDERLVVRELLLPLEQGEISYKVCLECRDWPAGAATTDLNIASVQQSKRTIVLVSPNHLDTQWCEFSFDVAHYQVLKDKQMHLILVLTDEKLEARLTRAMKFYMKTNTFLVIGEKWFWKKLRYLLSVNPRGADGVVGREFRTMRVY